MSKKIKIVAQNDAEEEEIPLACKGHNKPPIVGGISQEQLLGIIERVEKLEEDKSNIATAIRDVYSEAKGNGFDVKAIREIVRLRKIDAQDREEFDNILDIYKRAAGLLPSLDEMLED